MQSRTVDPYRFLDAIAKRAMKRWAELPGPSSIPWAPLGKPIRRCTVAIVSSAALVLKTGKPFDSSIERADPWTSDPSFRVLPRTARTGDVAVCHLHINPSFTEQDLNCTLPVEWLDEYAVAASSHYSYMGYTLRPQRMLQESVPQIVRQLGGEHVDAVLLVPV